MAPGRARVALLLIGVGVAAAMPTAGAPARPPNTNWTALLPALPSVDGPLRPVRGCRKPTLLCVRKQARRLGGLRTRLGCDHRAVFATTYMVLTRVLVRNIRREPRLVRYRRYLYREDTLFAHVYFRTVRRGLRGREVPEAWRIAFETAATGHVNAAQDMLLGINAHVQNDMPYVIAALGLRTAGDRSRKADHDALNEVLNRAYERVVNVVRRRYDPMVGMTNSSATELDDIAGLEMVRTWREGVWRNAERLANAGTWEERSQVADQIEANAATWAEAIAAMEQPGYRYERDSYCAARLYF